MLSSEAANQPITNFTKRMFLSELGMHRARASRTRRFSGSAVLGLAILGLGHSRARLFSSSVILGLGHSRARLFPISKIVETVIDIDFRHRE